MSADGHASSPEESLEHALAHARHLLPQQGPIAVFVHHNTLHAFEGMPFHEAIQSGERVFGGAPYMPEEAFRSLLAEGRITEGDIDAVLAECATPEDGVEIAGLVTRGALRRLLLHRRVDAPTRSEAAFLVADGGALDAFRPDVPPAERAAVRGSAGTREALDALYGACTELAKKLGDPTPERLPPPRRHRDVLLRETGVDVDDLVAPYLIRWSGAFLDGPTAYWPMPLRERGFFEAVRALEAQAGALRPRWASTVGGRFAELERRGLSAEAACLLVLHDLGVEPSRFEPFVTAVLQALPGFAGMFAKLEVEPEAHHGPGPSRLLDFLAVRLVLEEGAIRHVASAHGLGEPARLLSRTQAARVERPARPLRPSRAFLLFQLFQHLGVSAERAREVGRAGARALLDELSAFGSAARQRVFQEAYERHYAHEIMGSIAQHPPAPTFEPEVQIVTCIDEREESFRRAIEESNPLVETFGVAGFFGLPVEFRGIDDAHATARCPVVVVPERQIREIPLSEDATTLEARRRRKRVMAAIRKNLGVGSQLFVRGAVINALVGWLAVLPMAARVFAPRVFARLGAWWSERFFPKPRTRLLTEAELDPDEGAALGLPLDEQVSRVAAVLEGMGLRSGFAPLVVFLGHGSNSLNNPHESAHDCGACGGRHGGPNARLFAHLANDPRVRAGLRERGIDLPDATHFVGGEHDTCTDAVFFWDTERVPSTHRARFDAVVALLDVARAKHAHERCRRFDFAPHAMSPARALAEVERRAFAYDEPRPEYGHATNAFAVVGRRRRTRGLYLDRRGFLVSYDPTIDEDGSILTRTLAAAGPVAAGISLEYYFSFVDNERYGCGTKLPHNVTAGLGVMNGAGSDLRTGLPWQMVEIHEPVRLLLVVEATRERLLDVLDRLPPVRALVQNAWIRVAALEPDGAAVHELRPDLTWAPPITEAPYELEAHPTSPDYYGGKRGHLRPARIVGTARRSARGTTSPRAAVEASP